MIVVFYSSSFMQVFDTFMIDDEVFSNILVLYMRIIVKGSGSFPYSLNSGT
jgi:hypothetical protein